MRSHLMLGSIALSLSVITALAAQDLTLRTVRGEVTDEQNHPVAAAVVYLHDLSTNNVRTYIANALGRYHFSGIAEYDEYEVYARHDGLISHMHAISYLDTRRNLVVNLRLDRKQS